MSEPDRAEPQLYAFEPTAPPPRAALGFPIFGCPVFLSYEVVAATLILGLAFLPWMGLGGTSPDGWAAWAIAIAGTTLAAVAIHEFSHALVAWSFGLGVKHLYIGLSGGHTFIRRVDPPWWQSALVSAAGPLSNVALAAGCWWYWENVAGAGTWGDLFAAMAFWTNGLLAVTNLIPVLGIDGGGILQALAVPFSKDRAGAARNARRIGAGAMALVPLSFATISLYFGEFLPAGLWLLGAGWLLRSAFGSAKGAEEVMRLSGATVGDAMGPGVRIAPAHLARSVIDAQIQRDMEREKYTEAQRPFVVMDADGTVFGVLTPARIRESMHERHDWRTATVVQIMLPVGDVPVVSSELAALSAVTVAFNAGTDVLLVVDDGELVGCVTFADLDRVIAEAKVA